VAPPEFASSIFLWRADLWVPPSLAPMFIGGPFNKWGGSLYATARLAEGVSLDRARSTVATVAARLMADSARAGERVSFRIEAARGIVVELRGPTVLASSFLMVGQAYLEKRFGRGFGRTVNPDKDEAAAGLAIGASK